MTNGSSKGGLPQALPTPLPVSIPKNHKGKERRNSTSLEGLESTKSSLFREFPPVQTPPLLTEVGGKHGDAQDFVGKFRFPLTHNSEVHSPNTYSDSPPSTQRMNILQPQPGAQSVSNSTITTATTKDKKKKSCSIM